MDFGQALTALIAKDMRRVAGVVLAGSMSVVLSVVGAAYYVGAAQSQYRERRDMDALRAERARCDAARAAIVGGE